MTNAEAYDRGFAHLSSHTVGPLLAVARRSRGRRLLDVGCGTGVVTAAALALGAEVTAVDQDPVMLELLARRHPYATIRRAALPELPFEDERFDCVAGNFVINHVADAGAALRELHRVLRPGGSVALSWWKSDEMTATSVFSEAIAAAGVPYEPPVRPFGAHDTPPLFLALLEGAGFREGAVEAVRWRHQVDLGAWWTDVVGAGGPRFGMVGRQPPEVAERIRAEYLRLAAPYAEEGFPVCAYLAQAVK
ncbi:class I SAM-dependent methyltransferase [Nonomuraea gerenzanensis]|uniref:Methyltransferase n=1 Tax=Nonomuraea gerenzanensis TaxID=93944 RepID=A0A1M4EHB6_9ACTN|nr:class I SAM-dependent methyltransferase [Nonomuraea gerenzanensis]SBO98210.1 methyltransferase [Nonomuraea gerenzanensis]